MSYEPQDLCWCGHKQAMHEHYHHGGRPTYCGECGIDGDLACRLFTPRSRRPFNEAQRLAGEAADRRMLLTLVALSPFTSSTRRPVPPLPIPAQRRPPLRSVAQTYARSLPRRSG